MLKQQEFFIIMTRLIISYHMPLTVAILLFLSLFYSPLTVRVASLVTGIIDHNRGLATLLRSPLVFLWRQINNKTTLQTG